MTDPTAPASPNATAQISAQHHEAPPWAAGTETRTDELYPVLDAAEVDVIRSYGEERAIPAGTLLWDIGQRNVEFFLVLSGTMDILRRDDRGEHVIVSHGPGHYSGETVTMSGRGGFVLGRAATDLSVIALSNNSLRDLIALEAELGEKILQSFILRRMRMIADHLGDVVIVGRPMSKETGALRDFLSRNGMPHDVVDPDHDLDASQRATLKVTEADLPLVICGTNRLIRPSTKEVAACLGLTAQLHPDTEFDVAVIGAGPAGLAASVYAASEGLKVVTLEKCAIGGQAGSSSRIENYLGFPTGISGQALTGRGFLQATKFGAEVALAEEAAALSCGDRVHTITLQCGMNLKARSVVIASGAVYRNPSIERLGDFEGSSVHYGASHIHGMMCRNKDVAIVGGGNSAGQAAVYLSKRARKVYILIRKSDLAASMSDYLVRRIERIGNVELVPHTEVQRLYGEDHLTGIDVRNNQTNTEHRMDIAHLFVFIGAQPASDFAADQVIRDEKGFIKTGDALSDEELARAGWPLERRPYLLETSCPRVFAAGDIRSESVKRVASAVGEGSISIPLIHKVLEENASAGAAV